jgi:DHA1 family bicyclomycin/chloramphenicol resistance-like MFS transporter
MAVASTAMTGVLAGLLVHKHVVNIAMVVHVTGLGIFMPTAMAAAMARFPERAGTAAATLGFLQMTGGALGTVAVSGLQPAWPVLGFPAVMAGGAILALAAYVLLGQPTAPARQAAD